EPDHGAVRGRPDATPAGRADRIPAGGRAGSPPARPRLASSTIVDLDTPRWTPPHRAGVPAGPRPRGSATKATKGVRVGSGGGRCGRGGGVSPLSGERGPAKTGG